MHVEPEHNSSSSCGWVLGYTPNLEVYLAWVWATIPESMLFDDSWAWA